MILLMGRSRSNRRLQTRSGCCSNLVSSQQRRQSKPESRPVWNALYLPPSEYAERSALLDTLFRSAGRAGGSETDHPAVAHLGTRPDRAGTAGAGVAPICSLSTLG